MPHGYSDLDENHILQLALMKQGRLKLFTEKNLMSDWRPAYIDEWKKIADTITGLMLARKLAIQASPQTSLPRPLL